MIENKITISRVTDSFLPEKLKPHYHFSSDSSPFLIYSYFPSLSDVLILDQWEAKVERCQEDFESISKMIKTEMTRFDENRVMDFRNTIIKYLETLLRHQQQVINQFLSMSVLAF